MFWMVGVMLAAGCAAALPRGTGWPLPAGLGGVVGDAVVRLPDVACRRRAGGMDACRGDAHDRRHHAAVSHARGGFRLRQPPKPKKAVKPKVAAAADPDRDADEERAWISLGWLAHGFLSLKARIVRLIAGRPAAAPRRAPPVPAQSRLEPRFEGATLATLAPQARRGNGSRRRGGRRSRRRARARAPRKPKAAPRASRKSGGYQLPPLDLLAMPKRVGRATLSSGSAASQRDLARRRAAGFRRARRDHQCAARPGGHALRARARARHQVVARDRARRRHRPLDERALGPRRRGLGPQRHRHRAAEPDAREGVSSASCSPPRTTTTPPPSCRSASARPSAASR